MAKIPYGCILLARKLQQSDIWVKKPSWWLKVWMYMLIQVNHKDNYLFKRGQNFFTREKIYDDCKLYLEGIKALTVDNMIRWLRATRQATTQKTTRGIIITICNYELYQNMLNYKNDTENDTSNEIETTQKRHRNDTINNNVNNEKNVKNVKNEKKNDKSLVASPQSARTHFYSLYKQKTGHEYIADFGKDGAIFKSLLKIVPEDELKTLIDRFFESADDFIIKAGFTIGVFKTQVNKLRTGAKPLSAGAKTLMNAKNWIDKTK